MGIRHMDMGIKRKCNQCGNEKWVERGGEFLQDALEFGDQLVRSLIPKGWYYIHYLPEDIGSKVARNLYFCHITCFGLWADENLPTALPIMEDQPNAT